MVTEAGSGSTTYGLRKRNKTARPIPDRIGLAVRSNHAGEITSGSHGIRDARHHARRHRDRHGNRHRRHRNRHRRGVRARLRLRLIHATRPSTPDRSGRRCRWAWARSGIPTKPKPLSGPSCGRKRRAEATSPYAANASRGLIIRRIGKIANIAVHVSVRLSLLHSCHVCSLSGRTDSHGQNRSRRQPAYPARFTDVNLRQSQMWFPLECWKSQKDARTLNRTREAGVMTNPGFLASTLQKVTCRPVSGVSSITTN